MGRPVPCCQLDPDVDLILPSNIIDHHGENVIA